MSQENFTPLRGETTQPNLEKRWDELRSNIRKTWPELSKDDLREIDGDSRKLIALVHQRTGADLSEIEEKIDEIAASSEGLLNRVARTAQQAYSSAAEHIGEPLSHAYSSTRQQIVTAPGRSVGLAFGLGILIGLSTASIVKDMQASRSRSHRYFW